MKLEQAYLHEALDYDPDTGGFVWKIRPQAHFRTQRGMRTFNSRFAGKPAGHLDSLGHIVIGRQLAQRLAWIYVNGECPSTLRHINEIRSDNRISNLAEAHTIQTCEVRPRNLDRQKAESLFRYDQSTGGLFWKERPRSHFNTTRGWKLFNKKFCGKEAGFLGPAGYRIVEIDGNGWAVHRIVWLLHTGFLPERLDHVNRVRSDNRIENLRECSASQNTVNSSKKPEGCYLVRGRWRVLVGFNNKNIHVGYFRDKDAAQKAYARKRNELFGDFVPHHV
jgi:hypothetical protein